MPGVTTTHDSRIKDFKNTGRHEEMRRRRTEGSVELRKQKKEENLMKRRNMMSVEDDESELSDNAPTSPKKAEVSTPMSLAECADVLVTRWGEGSAEVVESAVENVRRKLSVNSHAAPPIKEVINLGLVKPLIQLLDLKPTAKTQFEAAWALTNIVSGTPEETMTVVKAGGVGPLIRSLASPELNVAEQATWALGNIAGDGPTLRDQVLDEGVLPAMLQLAHRPEVSVEFLRTLAWAFSNFCRHKNPNPPLSVVQTLLPYMAKLLYHPDKTVVTDTCWAVSYLTDGPDQQIQAAIDAGVMPRVVELLGSTDKSFQAPALRALGNIVTGNDEHTQAVVDSGILNGRIRDLLSNPNPAKESEVTLLKEAMWMVSNILAGNADQVQNVIDAGLLPDIARSLEHSVHKVRSEAAWAVVNLTTSGTAEQVLGLVEAGILPAIAAVLTVKDSRVVSLLLEGLYNILCKAKAVGVGEKAATAVEEAGLLDELERLQEHEEDGVYKMALRIIETFFSDEEGGDDTVDVGDISTPASGPAQYEF